MKHFNQWVNTTFDAIQNFWDSATLRRWITWLLIASFFLTIALIEAKRMGFLSAWLPAPFVGRVPRNHFYAVSLVFTILLVFEVASLALSIAGSVANALGKQFEILSLILLRQAFKEFVYFDEPILWEKIQIPVAHMLSDASGGVMLFFAVWVYYRIQPHRAITSDPEERYRFITAKKSVALVLLAVFIVLGMFALWGWLLAPLSTTAITTQRDSQTDFFDAFYTALIFSDILLVLISLRYSSHYPIVFRNSGFALATVFIRLALTAPPYVNVAVAFAAVLFAIALSLVYRTSLSENIEKDSPASNDDNDNAILESA
jgi:hypothetical protein